MKSNKKRSSSQPLAKKWMHVSSQEADILLIESQESIQHSMELFDSLVACSPHEDDSFFNIPSKATISHLQCLPLCSAESTDESTPSKTVLQEEFEHISLKQILISECLPVTSGKSRKGCNCKNNKCQKRYCDCFRMGLVCDQGLCSCLDCHNIQSTSHHNHAFFQHSGEVANVKKGCNCKKSRCLKNYCQCHSSGRKCGESCQCIDCCNHQQQPLISNQQPKKYRKVHEVLLDDDLTPP